MQILSRITGRNPDEKPTMEEVGKKADQYFHDDSSKYDTMTIEYEGKAGDIKIIYTKRKLKGKS